MARICLDLEDRLAAAGIERAQSQGISFSEYIAQLISKDCAKPKWPASFWTTYGAVSEADGFTLPEDPVESSLVASLE